MRKILILALVTLICSSAAWAEHKTLWKAGDGTGLNGTDGTVNGEYGTGLIVSPDAFKNVTAGMKLKVEISSNNWTEVYLKSFDEANKYPPLYSEIEISAGGGTVSQVLTLGRLAEMSTKGLRIDASVVGTKITEVWVDTDMGGEDLSDALWIGSQNLGNDDGKDVVTVDALEAALLKPGDTLKIYYDKADGGYLYINYITAGGWGEGYKVTDEEWNYTDTGASFVVKQDLVDLLKDNRKGFIIKGKGHTVKHIDTFRLDWANLKIDGVKIETWEGPLFSKLGEWKNFTHVEASDINAREGLDIWALDVTSDTPEIDTYVSQFDLHVDFKGGGQYVFVDVHSADTYVDAYSKFWCQNSRMEPGVGVKKIFFIYDRNAQFNESKKETPFQFMFSSDGEFHYNAYRQQPLNSDTYALRLSEGEVYEALRGTQTGTIEIPFIRHHIAKEGFSINLGKEVTVKDAERFRLLVNNQNAPVHFILDEVYEDGFEAHTPIDGDAAGIIDGTKSPEGLTFSKIALMVAQNPNDGAFTSYTMYLLDKNNEPVDFISNGYNTDASGAIDRDSQKNPKLKIWRDGDSEWVDLNKQKDKFEPSGDRGSVTFFDFKPVLTEFQNNVTGVAKKTNIYHLALPGGVKIKGKNGVKSDMFNVIDNEGYDISNPYQGSQVIYPNEWWCINPSIGFKTEAELRKAYPDVTDIRELDGFYFPPLHNKLGESKVDLSWGVDSNTPEASLQEGSNDAYETTIYGITIFKIMGYGYDVYAKTFKERPLYYMYAETDPAKTNQYEKTAPIVLQVNDNSEVKIMKELATRDGEAVPQYAEPKKFNPTDNNPTLLKKDGSVRYYQLGLSQVQLTGNDDLNWLLCDETGSAVKNIRFVPESAKSIAFVDVTGTQTWDANGDADRLTPNTWSNYYSTYDKEADDLQIDQYGKDTEYFRLVLATNPDAARYQILTKDSKIDGKMNYRFLSQNKIDLSEENFSESMGHPTANNEKAYWIYPTIKLNGKFLIANDTDDITLSLDGKNIVTIGGVKLEDESNEDSAYLVDEKNQKITGNVQLVKKTDAFLEPGEYIFSYDLGEYFVNPDFKDDEASADDSTDAVKKTIKAKVAYGPSKEMETEINVIGINVPGIEKVRVPHHNYDPFFQPIYLTEYANYYAQLIWDNAENPDYIGLPRTYTVSGKEVESFKGNNHGHEITIAEDILHKGYVHNYHTFTRDSQSLNVELNDGTEWFNHRQSANYFAFDENNVFQTNCFQYPAHDDCKAVLPNSYVVIEYSVRPTYHFAIPKPSAELSEVPGDMTEMFVNGPQTETAPESTARKAAPAASDFYAVTLKGVPASVPVKYGYNVATGIDGVTVDASECDGIEEYYNLQGVKVNGDPAPGIYILRKGSVSRKVLVR